MKLYVIEVFRLTEIIKIRYIYDLCEWNNFIWTNFLFTLRIHTGYCSCIIIALFFCGLYVCMYLLIYNLGITNKFYFLALYKSIILYISTSVIKKAIKYFWVIIRNEIPEGFIYFYCSEEIFISFGLNEYIQFCWSALIKLL